MSDVNELVGRYIAAWNEPQERLRLAALAGVYAPDGTYTDPLADVRGHEAIAGVIAAAQGMFPGHTFRLAGEVEAHHAVARFTWELVPDGGEEAVVVGSDVAAVGADGRLSSVIGFLDKAPAV